MARFSDAQRKENSWKDSGPYTKRLKGNITLLWKEAHCINII
jgi:hypothetical protein